MGNIYSKHSISLFLTKETETKKNKTTKQQNKTTKQQNKTTKQQNNNNKKDNKTTTTTKQQNNKTTTKKTIRQQQQQKKKKKKDFISFMMTVVNIQNMKRSLISLFPVAKQAQDIPETHCAICKSDNITIPHKTNCGHVYW